MAILPDFILNKLKLNDRLIIKDRRYIINNITSNLTKREDTLELINDIYKAPLQSDVLTNSAFRFSSGIYSLEAQTYDAEYIGLDGVTVQKVDSGYGTSWITLNTIKTPARVGVISFTLSENTSGLDRNAQIQVLDGINNPRFLIFQEA